MPRLDQMLVERGLAPSRSAAQRLIERGAVRWRSGGAPWEAPRKAGQELPQHAEVDVTDVAELRWASRAGLKLEGALSALGLTVQGCMALDVGQSTGGFTDVLLSQGARRVVGVDVGHGQLLQRLREDPRVACIEGCNARELSAAQLQSEWPTGGFDWIVGDLSFISQILVWPALKTLLSSQGQMLMLVKPQFELRPQDIGKGGLVRDEALLGSLCERMSQAAHAQGLRVLNWIDSPITGGDGNREFFIHMRVT